MYLSRGTFLIGQLISKALNTENINLGSQEDADTPQLKAGDKN
jgi:hypothetical protein